MRAVIVRSQPSRLRRAAAWMAGCLVASAPAMVPAADIGGPIDYVLQTRTIVQQQSNAFRFSDRNEQQRETGVAIQNVVAASAEMPLLSEHTRLVASASVGDVRYDTYPELNHSPAHADIAVPWRAGDLFAGAVGYGYDNRLYRYLNRTFPDRDIVETERPYFEAGLRVTDRLTLPIVTVAQTRARYDLASNARLFNRDETRKQLSFRYDGLGRSTVTGGLWQADGEYLDRDDTQAAQIGREYRDREVFVSGQWEYSPKTQLGGRIGYRQRSYPTLSERDSNLLTLYLRAGWDYSVKTRFDLNLWRQPYPNDENPAVLYSTQTGGRVSMRWKASEKLFLSFNVVAETQRDTLAGSSATPRRQALRAGPRVEWNVNRNVSIMLDGWHDRTSAQTSAESYTDNVLRLGVVFSTDNSDAPRPRQMLWQADCEPPKYVESSLCN